MKNFAVCINNESNPASLILGKVYPTLPDAEAEPLNMIRIALPLSVCATVSRPEQLVSSSFFLFHSFAD
jgi:hypothetical protein